MDLPSRNYVWSGYTGLANLKPLLDCCCEFLLPLFETVDEPRYVAVLQDIVLFFHVAHASGYLSFLTASTLQR